MDVDRICSPPPAQRDQTDAASSHILLCRGPGRNQVGVRRHPRFFRELTHFTCKFHHRLDLNPRKGRSCAATCGRLLVGIPVFMCLRASPMFCLRLRVTFHPLTCPVCICSRNKSVPRKRFSYFQTSLKGSLIIETGYEMVS